jgi:protein-tyrosine phosphatase
MPWWRRFRQVDWHRVERLVFICRGNICRSAYAATKARALGVPSQSGGLHAKSGCLADNEARRHAAARGLSLEAHTTKVLRELAIGAGDLVICMEPPQLRAVRKVYPTFSGQLTLLGFWSQPHRPWIFDPFGLADEPWRYCLDLIDDAVWRITDLYRRQHPSFAQSPLDAEPVMQARERGSLNPSEACPQSVVP